MVVVVVVVVVVVMVWFIVLFPFSPFLISFFFLFSMMIQKREVTF